MKKQKQFVLFYLPWDFDLLGGVDVVVDRLYSGTVGKGLLNGIIGLQSWTHNGIGKGFGDRTFIYLNFPEPPPIDSSWLENIRYALTLLRRLPTALRQLRSLGVTVINAHFPTRNLYGLAIAKRLGLWRGRLILSFHGSDIKAIEPTDPAWQLIVSQANGCICCSKALEQQLKDISIFNQIHTVAIHNGMDCRSFTERHQGLNTNTKQYLLNIGNYVEAKGQDQSIRAFAAISQKHPDLHLVFAGGRDNGKWLKHLKDLCLDLAIDNRVTFRENVPREDIPGLICNALAFVHTPHREAFGLVLVEAGCFGIPVIANHVGGIPEIIEDSVTGILVKPNDHDELTYSIERLLADGQLREQIGKALQRKVLQQFSVENMCSKYLAALSTTSN